MSDLINATSEQQIADQTTPDPQLEGLTTVGEDGRSALDHLARILHARADLASTLEAVLQTAIRVCPGFEAAGVNLFVKGQFEPQQVLGGVVPPLDRAQRSSGRGPCIDASREQRPIVVPDFGDEDRWAEYIEAALAHDVRSMLCVPLWIDDDSLGSLSLYSSTPREISDQTVAVASLVATHAAIAIASARRADNLAAGIAGRDAIGQAKGILMERHRITADAAFELIRDTSMAMQQKVQVVAERLITSGELPSAR